MAGTCTLGLDFGTNSVRAIVVETSTGAELGTSVFEYRMGQRGVILDTNDPHLARQHPRDYLDGMEASVCDALEIGRAHV